MQLNIEEQIPIRTKIYSNEMVAIPADVKKILNWHKGDEIELYATTKGIFIKKINDKEVKNNVDEEEA